MLDYREYIPQMAKRFHYLDDVNYVAIDEDKNTISLNMNKSIIIIVTVYEDFMVVKQNNSDTVVDCNADSVGKLVDSIINVII